MSNALKKSLKIFFCLFVLCICTPAMGAADVDIVGELTAETRAGQLDTLGDDGVQPTGQLVLTPALIITRTTPRASSTAQYQLRIFSSLLQDENQAFQIYNQLMLNHEYAISRRTQWRAMGSLDYGRLDYSRSLFRTAAQGAADDSASPEPGGDSLVELPINRYVALRGSTGMSYRMTPATQLRVMGSYGTTAVFVESQPTDDTETENTSGDFAHTTGINVDINSVISSTDQLTFSTDATAARFADDTWSFPVNLSLTWQRQMHRNATISLVAGVSFITEENTYVAPPEDGDDPGDENDIADTTQEPYVLHVLPTGGFIFTVQPQWNTITSWTLSGLAMVDTYVDTVEAVVLPRLSNQFSATSVISPRMQFQTTVGASTPLISNSTRVENAVIGYPANVSADIGFLFIFTPNIQLRTAVEGNARISYPFDSPIRWGPWEFVGVATLNLRLPLTD